MLSKETLVEHAKKHKIFLERLHEIGVSTSVMNSESIRRYELLWLPLVYQYSFSTDQKLLPPPDIAWLWHCHRLAPKEYVSHIRNKFGQGAVVEANPPFAFQLQESDNQNSIAYTTRQIWNDLYPNDVFFLQEGDKEAYGKTLIKKDATKWPLVGNFDLIASTQRQATFLWQISGDRFEDDEFLHEGASNYIKFLSLRHVAKRRQVVLVPTYQIDLFWHTHILTSVTNYNTDCIAILGETLHHDDSLTDRSDGGLLDVSFKATQDLWRQEYGFEYSIDGGMYRGEPPLEYFAFDWKPWKCHTDWIVHANLHLVGKVGASSTAAPTKWASPTGLTSEGWPAFIPTNTRNKAQLKSQERRTNYVLGKTSNGTGYFHLETLDAQVILYSRVSMKIAKLKSEIAWEQGCCGNDPGRIARLEKELNEMLKVQSILSERKNASAPRGPTSTTTSESATDTRYIGTDGVWLYPTVLYDCAGGACGGTVACSGAACGGSACGGKD
jgi:Glycine-rich domain-containing protein-like